MIGGNPPEWEALQEDPGQGYSGEGEAVSPTKESMKCQRCGETFEQHMQSTDSPYECHSWIPEVSPTKESMERAREWWHGEHPSQPDWRTSTEEQMLNWHDDMVVSLATLLDAVRDIGREEGKSVCQFYPHMCRDGHDEVGWRGDEELCPACRALNERDFEWVKAVEKVRETKGNYDPPLPERTAFEEACDEILREMEVTNG